MPLTILANFAVLSFRQNGENPALSVSASLAEIPM
jgi:hypothetical protein